MYIIDGVAYAGEQMPIIEIIGVRPMDGNRLWIRFKTGETGVFDFSPLLNDPAFIPLQDKNIFQGVYLDNGVPCWNDGGIDISPAYLYQHAILNESPNAS